MALAVNPALLDRFLTFINPLLPPGFESGKGLLLAVSGGLDSVVMAHLVHRAGLRFAIAHVNFGLRGSESIEDAAWVEALAQHYHVPFYLTHFDTTRFAGQTGVSVQMAARTLRYEWFEQLRAEHHYSFIATAHHRNDVIETLLLNLTRGTGLAGLHGMAAQQGKLLRPLLFADRVDLETYATDHQLDWREDRSNQSDYYARNRIRHHVVPVLQSINPGLLQTLNTTLERLRAAETLMQQELDRSASLVVKTTDSTTQIDLISLRMLPQPTFRLAEWLRPFGFTYQQSTAIWQAIGQGQGQEFGSATHRLVHERNQLIVSRNLPVETAPVIKLLALPENPVLLSSDSELRFRVFDKPANFEFPADPKVASFDADTLAFPLTIRRWQEGDRFRPLGMKGTKLVSDLLADLKVPRLEREQTYVLAADEQIAWVIGYRLSHPFRVRAQTKRVMQVCLVK